MGAVLLWEGKQILDIDGGDGSTIGLGLGECA